MARGRWPRGRWWTSSAWPSEAAARDVGCARGRTEAVAVPNPPGREGGRRLHPRAVARRPQPRRRALRAGVLRHLPHLRARPRVDELPRLLAVGRAERAGGPGVHLGRGRPAVPDPDPPAWPSGWRSPPTTSRARCSRSSSRSWPSSRWASTTSSPTCSSFPPRSSRTSPVSAGVTPSTTGSSRSSATSSAPRCSWPRATGTLRPRSRRLQGAGRGRHGADGQRRRRQRHRRQRARARPSRRLTRSHRTEKNSPNPPTGLAACC